jgi:nucleoside-diphosphate kinase
MKKARLTKEQAAAFYAEHKKRPFYDSLCAYMSSGPVIVAVLGGPNVIEGYRKLEGATDPTKAAEGTLRRIYGTNRESNAVHGSDGPESAKRETRFFFSDFEISNASR